MSTNLETGGDHYVAVDWIDDALHVALCDVGDGDELGEGRDVDDPRALLVWMLGDRFTGTRASRRVLDYCAARRVAAEEVGVSDVERGYDGAPTLTLTDDDVFVHDGEWGEPLTAHRVDWRALVVALIVDRCEGAGAWDRVARQLEAAGVSATEKWRGYV